MIDRLRDILLWAAADSGRDIYPDKPLDEPTTATLLSLTRKHRMTTRLLYRLRETREPASAWHGSALLADLRACHARAVVRQDEKINALREINAHLLPHQRPLAIKGFCTYARTGDPRHVRLSGDLDLLCADPETLNALLRSLGYAGETFGPERHEYAHLRRGNVAIEIHRFFPVYAYPDGMKDSVGSLPLEGGVQNFGPPLRTDVSWSDLMGQAIPGETLDTRDLLLPDPAAAAFLLCAHEFKEYLTSPFELSIPVRLAIAAEIRDLTKHPSFSHDVFASLVDRFGGEDAVALLSHLLQAWLGSTGLQPFTAPIEKPRAFPRPVGFRGAWANLYPPEEGIAPPDLGALLRHPTLTHCPIMHQHEGDGTAADRPPRVVACDWTEEDLVVTLSSPADDPADARWRVRVDWDGENKPVSFAQEFSADAGDSKGQWRFPIPRRLLPEDADSASSGVPLLLTLQRRCSGVADFFDADVVFAVILRTPIIRHALPLTKPDAFDKVGAVSICK